MKYRYSADQCHLIPLPETAAEAAWLEQRAQKSLGQLQWRTERGTIDSFPWREYQDQSNQESTPQPQSLPIASSAVIASPFPRPPAGLGLATPHASRVPVSTTLLLLLGFFFSGLSVLMLEMRPSWPTLTVPLLTSTSPVEAFQLEPIPISPLLQFDQPQAQQQLASFFQEGSQATQNVIHGRALDDSSPIYQQLNPERLEGLLSPVVGYRIPLNSPALLPNAPRGYRNGTHEGYDVPAPIGTNLQAVYHGTVIRADHGYQVMSPAEFWPMLNDTFRHASTPESTLDALRGRQVWVDHGNGVVTRYAHLNRIDSLIQVGSHVSPGQLVGEVGRSGLEHTNFGAHLHFEILVNGEYLGQNLAFEEITQIIDGAFE